MSEKTHQVNESADKITVKTKIVRGNGTRDQDKIDVKVKGDNAEIVVDKLNDTLERLESTTQRLRDTQPSEGED